MLKLLEIIWVAVKTLRHFVIIVSFEIRRFLFLKH